MNRQPIDPLLARQEEEIEALREIRRSINCARKTRLATLEREHDLALKVLNSRGDITFWQAFEDWVLAVKEVSRNAKTNS